MTRVTVTKMERVEREGAAPFFRANASINGSTRTFENRYGAWHTPRRPRADADWPKHATEREALPDVADALQRHLPREARGPRR